MLKMVRRRTACDPARFICLVSVQANAGTVGRPDFHTGKIRFQTGKKLSHALKMDSNNFETSFNALKTLSNILETVPNAVNIHFHALKTVPTILKTIFNVIKTPINALKTEFHV